MDFRLNEVELEIQRSTRSFCDSEVAPMVDDFESGRGSPKKLIQAMGGQGLFELVTPKRYGGRFETVRSLPLCVAREELAYTYNYAGASIATQGLGAVPIGIAGNDDQKAEYLPAMSKGECIGSFALTEPEAGSDAASVQTRAVRTNDGYRIDGQKRFISNAGICQVYIVFAKTDPDAGSRGLSAFIVDAKTPGLKFRPMQVICYDVLGALEFEGVEVPESSLLGSEKEGFKIAMKTLDVLRATVGSHAVGTSRAAMEYAIEYANGRIQFGKPLSKQQAVQFMLAEMAVEITAARLLVYQAAQAHDDGDPEITLKSSMAKLYATEAAQRVVDKALQIHGGNGLLTKEYPMERLYREVRAPRIYEGTSEIQKLIIAHRLMKS